MDGDQSRGYPMSNFVYLLSVDFAPAFLRNAKSAPPATRPPNKATITIGLMNTSTDSLLKNEHLGYITAVLEPRRSGCQAAPWGTEVSDPWQVFPTWP